MPSAFDRSREAEKYGDSAKQLRKGTKWALLAMMLFLAAGFGVDKLTETYSQETVVTVVVCNTESVSSGSSHQYRIHASDGEEITTYVVKDGIVNGIQLNSADIYGVIEEGKTYTLTVYGWRLPAISMFKHITELEEVPEEQQLDQDVVCDPSLLP